MLYHLCHDRLKVCLLNAQSVGQSDKTDIIGDYLAELDFDLVSD